MKVINHSTLLAKCWVFLALAAGTAEATITVTDRGTGNSNASTSSIVVTPTSGPLLAGSTAILHVAMDNASAPATNFTATSFTDSVGNTWTMRVEQVNGSTPNGSAELAIWISTLTANFGTGDSLTLNLAAAAVAKTWTLTEAAPSAGNVVAFSETKKNVATAQTAISLVSSTVLVGDLIICAVGAEGPDTFGAGGDADTLNGAWSTAQHTGVGSGAAGMSIISQWKVGITDSGQQTYDATLSSSDGAVMDTLFIETDPKMRGANGNGTNATTLSIPILAPLSVGSLAVLCLSADNAGSTGSAANLPPASPATITDSQSNTWTQRQTAINDPGAANGGVEVAIYTSVLTHALAITDTISLGTFTVTIPAKTWALWEFAPSGAGSMTYVTGGVGSATNTATPTLTTGSITSGDYIVAMCGAEGATSLNFWVGDSDTSSGSWKQQISSSGGLLQGGQYITSQYKKVTGTATQTYNPVYGAAVDQMIAWIEINDSSPTSSITRVPAIPALPTMPSLNRP